MNEARVRAAFLHQAASCRAWVSPFTAALCDRLADLLHPSRGLVAARVLDWRGKTRPGPGRGRCRCARALRCMRGVLTRADPALCAAYRTRRVDDAAILGALARHEAMVLAWLDSPPQTNEVGCAAALIATARFLASMSKRPIRALEAGASAGLSLDFAHCRPTSSPAASRPNGATRDREEAVGPVLLCPDWQGAIPRSAFDVAKAEGVDLRPLDPMTDGLRLMAYCWADQSARLDACGRRWIWHGPTLRRSRPAMRPGDGKPGWHLRHAVR